MRRVLTLPVLALSLAPGARADVIAYEQAELTAGDPAPWDELGAAVSISGQTIVAGAMAGDDAGLDSGAAYVYVQGSGTWNQQAKLVAGDAAPDDRFGSAVGISGERIVVGSPFDDDLGSSSGSAYVFLRSGFTWIQEAKLTASDAAMNDAFGSAVAIDGDTIAVGAPGGDDSGLYTGAVYVYTRTASGWIEQAKLLSSSMTSSAYFGASLDLDGDRLAVGATGSGRGVYVYDRVGSVWGFTQRLTDPTGSPPDRFAISVSLDGDRVVAGAPGDDDNGSNSGAAVLFAYDGMNWQFETRLYAGESFGELGTSVALSGDLLLAGAPWDWNLGDTPQGAAYVFSFDGTSWGLSTRMTSSSANDYDEFGAAVALDGDLAAVGVPEGDAAGVNAGEVGAFALVSAPFVYCFGDGSSVPCGCGNEVPGEQGGCANSTGEGATLWVVGGVSVAADGATFDARHLLPNQPALLFAGLNAVNGGDGVSFGDGLRCAGGGVVRLGVRIPNAGGAATWGPGLAPTGGWTAGDTRRFQVWYRDPTASPCGTGFNLTNGLEVVFVP